MRSLFAAVAAVAVLGTGCMIRLPVASSRAAVSSEKKCPPGHVWSDGSCHDKGKGHDPAKHQK